MEYNKRFIELMHRYLDGETTNEEKAEFLHYIETNVSCKKHYEETRKAIAFVQSASHIETSANFTNNVLQQLPKRKKRVAWKQWMRNHPLAVAASIFLILMSSSIISVWNSSEELSVTGNGNIQIDHESGKVIVPEGEVIEGNLVVRNGTLELNGEVRGNVLLVNSEKYLASAGSVSGEIDEVTQVLEWIWYHIKSFFSDVTTVVGNEKENID
ncbi:anti-sigma factor family protein [Bacillus sp. FJAT-45350]|uniref:anti-sigma factor family protein n=1 Tax=Bacillus sp. FJAT-45350 TaxID=2011014 RepID=UPI000BB9A1C2|nr:anti-sigma factor [Bacillus sp. FJAT-45350]